MSGTKPQEEEEEEEEFRSKGFSRLGSARSVTTELKKHREPREWEATKEKRGMGSGIPGKSSAGGGKSPRASLEVAVALALDGFLDAQQHRGEPLIQP